MILDNEKAPIMVVEREIETLYDAIVECRRDDAIEAMCQLFQGYQFRSAKEQRNLFPDRVPA